MWFEVVLRLHQLLIGIHFFFFRSLRPFEPHLAGIALSNVESSRTIAQVLYEMSDSRPRK